MTPAPGEQMTAAQVLTRAAGIAASQPTVRKAIQLGWSACHANRDLITAVFTAWQQSEGVTYLYDLGDYLHRRYRRATPADVAASLRKAAAACAGSGEAVA